MHIYIDIHLKVIHRYNTPPPPVLQGVAASLRPRRDPIYTHIPMYIDIYHTYTSAYVYLDIVPSPPSSIAADGSLSTHIHTHTNASIHMYTSVLSYLDIVPPPPSISGFRANPKPDLTPPPLVSQGVAASLRSRRYSSCHRRGLLERCECLLYIHTCICIYIKSAIYRNKSTYTYIFIKRDREK